MNWFEELWKVIKIQGAATKASLLNFSWESITHSITHMGPVEHIGWLVTILFLVYHGIKNQRTRLLVAKACSVITIVYFFLRGDLPMFVKWLFVMGINVYMWVSLKPVDHKKMVDD